MAIKDIGSLAREIAQNSSGSFPLVVLDTGGLIDIVSATRMYNFNHKNGNKDPRYELTISFLKHLSERLPVLITPRTYKEMQEHGNVMLNDHGIYEIPPKVVDFTLGTMEESIKFISRLKKGTD